MAHDNILTLTMIMDFDYDHDSIVYDGFKVLMMMSDDCREPHVNHERMG